MGDARIHESRIWLTSCSCSNWVCQLPVPSRRRLRQPSPAARRMPSLKRFQPHQHCGAHLLRRWRRNVGSTSRRRRKPTRACRPIGLRCTESAMNRTSKETDIETGNQQVESAQSERYRPIQHRRSRSQQRFLFLPIRTQAHGQLTFAHSLPLWFVVGGFRLHNLIADGAIASQPTLIHPRQHRHSAVYVVVYLHDALILMGAVESTDILL